MTHSKTEPSMGELVSQLSEQTSRLVRDEMRLAQKEIQESAKHAGLGAGMVGAAAPLSVLGLATLNAVLQYPRSAPARHAVSRLLC